MTKSSESVIDLPASVTSSVSSSPGYLAKLAFPIAYLAVAAALAALFLSIVKVNHGTFLYTLDDPYIHLALSNQIRHGNYGLYPGTHAAPSSSILFPFILALASGTPLHPYFPLVINICALFLTLEIMRRFLLHLRFGSDGFAMVVQAGMVLVIAVSFNLLGVVFTGLEHSLHIAAVAATLYGLALFLDRGEVPAWLPPVLVLSPLLRYEGLALSFAVLLVLALRGRLRIALATFSVIAVLVVGFSLFLKKLGLAALPSSVLTKSGVAAGGLHAGHFHVVRELVRTATFMYDHSVGIPILLIGVAAAVRLAQILVREPRNWTPDNSMVLVLFCLVGAHSVAGRFGWMERYEVYLLLGITLILIYLGRSAIRAQLSHGRRDLFVIAGTALAFLVFGERYWYTTILCHKAANDIYQQQFQMHRFVDGYWRGPVAVNDLGLVSYNNPYPVLDLGGLGSEKARHLIDIHADAATYRAFVADNGVHLAIVYPEWFAGEIPDTWIKTATLSLTREKYAAGEPDVDFFATDPATAVIVREELKAFQETLPPGIAFEIYPAESK